MLSIDEIKNKAINVIAAQLYSSDTTKYREFAFYLIDNNITSDYIFILAGLNNDILETKQHYFNLILEELNVSIDTKTRLDFVYAKNIANQVIFETLDPVIGVKLLEKLYIKQDYDPYYLDFMEMSDAIDLLEDGYELIQGMHKNNYKEYIKHTFELFLLFSELNLPENIYQQAYCKKCRNRIIPKLKTKRRKIIGKRYNIQYCPICKNKEFYWIRYNEGKDIYLQEIRLTTASTL